nr:hypothetical protein [Fredinandcohnia onubensis]
MPKDKPNVFDPNDTYGILKSEIEADTDVNEDQNREKLLDDSVEAFLELKKSLTE